MKKLGATTKRMRTFAILLTCGAFVLLQLNVSLVTTIDAPGALCELATVVRGAAPHAIGTGLGSLGNCSFPVTHGTRDTGAQLSGEKEDLVEEITREDYQVRRPYLAHEGRARVEGKGWETDERKGAEQGQGKHKDNRKEKFGGQVLELPRAGGPPGGATAGTTRSLVCICAKCGSTSFYRSLYEVAFGRKWEYKGPPWIHTMTSARWEGVATPAVVGGDADPLPLNSFAVIRDPRERIMSAFRSKVACEGGVHVDANDRKHMVPELLQLAGFVPFEKYGTALPGESGLCLNSTAYLRALRKVWRSGREGKLDCHFRPQTQWCFRRIPPEDWSVVTTIDAPGALCELATVVRGAAPHANVNGLGAPGNCSSFPVTHRSRDTGAQLSGEEKDILEEITREEYAVLGPYLAHEGRARVKDEG